MAVRWTETADGMTAVDLGKKGRKDGDGEGAGKGNGMSPRIHFADGRLGTVAEKPPPSAFPHMRRRPHARYFTTPAGEAFRLQSGRTLPSVTLAFETYGRLTPAKDNAILIAHALTGDAHCASHGPGDAEEGWWEPLVGPGRVFDTDRYFVICANVLGGCQGSTGPASIEPTTGQPYGIRFPVVTIPDMVRAQKRLIDFLGIRSLAAVAGGSMGGMQALEWAVQFPEMVRGLIPIASPARSYPQAIAYNEVARRAIMNDPAWRGGDYYGTPGPVQGLAVARMLGMITYQSDASMRRKFGRDIVQERETDPFTLEKLFQVESYLEYQGKKLVERFDANTLLYLTRALDLFDAADGFRSLEAAVARIQCPVLVVGVSSDILYPVEQQRELVGALRVTGKTVKYTEIDTPHGHDGFLIDFPKMEPSLRRFLQELPE